MNRRPGWKAPPVFKIRCALCRRWLPQDDRLATPAGLAHFRCVATFQAAKLTLTTKPKET